MKRILCFLSLLLLPVQSGAGDTARHCDEFLAGYVSSVLEAVLGWDKGSYRLDVSQGVVTITANKIDHKRCAEAVERLGKVESLKEVRIVMEPPGSWKHESVQTVEELARSETGAPDIVIDFPAGDLFRPLIADPKQPQFFISYRRYDTSVETANVGAVGFGENFGLVRFQKEKGNGLQFGLDGALFAQFNLDAPSSDLVNADYLIGLPVTWRRGATSVRLRVYHQSSHLGDEFLLRLKPERVNLSYEAANLLVSQEWWSLRGYFGGEYLFHREPGDLEPASLQGGIEYYGSKRLCGGRVVGGVDLKSYEEHNWSVDASAKAGLEFGQPDPGKRRLRVLAEGYKGYAPNGQFYKHKISYYGLGVYFGF